jgi:hypothetical protein
MTDGHILCYEIKKAIKDLNPEIRKKLIDELSDTIWSIVSEADTDIKSIEEFWELK